MTGREGTGAPDSRRRCSPSLIDGSVTLFEAIDDAGGGTDEGKGNHCQMKSKERKELETRQGSVL